MANMRSITSKILDRTLNRRALFSGAGKAAAAGAFVTGCASVAATPAAAEGNAAGVGDPVLTILYPREEDATFDIDYYRDHHLPLIMELYGEAIRRFELIQPVEPEGAPPPAWFAVVNIYIADADAFAAAGEEHGPTLIDDVPNFSSVLPQVTNGVIYGLDWT